MIALKITMVIEFSFYLFALKIVSWYVLQKLVVFFFNLVKSPDHSDNGIKQDDIRNWTNQTKGNH